MFILSKIGRSEDCERCAACLALISVSAVIGWGCHSKAEASPPRHSVNISALLPLHPAWKQLTSLREQLAESEPPIEKVRFVPTELPPPFTPPSGLPPSRIADHEKVVLQDGFRYIAQLESALSARSAEYTQAEARADEQAAVTLYNAAVNKRTTELRDEAVVKAKVIQLQVNKLNYRQEALLSQYRVYTELGFNARRMLDDVRQQQAEVDHKVQLANAEITGLLEADFAGLANEALKGYRRELDDDAKAKVAEFKRKQAISDEREIAAAKKRVDAQPTPIPVLTDRGVTAADTGITLNQTVQPSDQGVAGAEATDRLTIGASAKRVIQHQIDQLSMMISVDTKRSVESIALKERWRLAPPGEADDWTARVARRMRAEMPAGAAE